MVVARCFKFLRIEGVFFGNQTNSKRACVLAGYENIESYNYWFEKRARALAAERETAAAKFCQGRGFLWFLHNQKAAGSSVCGMLKSKLHDQSITGNCFIFKGCNHPWVFQSKETWILQNKKCFSSPGEWELNQAVNASEAEHHIQNLETTMKKIHPDRTLLASETSFIPRGAIKKWIVDGDPKYTKIFENWSFVFNIRHPVQRLFSAFHYHKNQFGPVCGEDFMSCLSKEILTSGIYRNKIVREISGFFNKKGREATREDLEIAKLVLHRFLPIFIADEADLLLETFKKSVCNLGLDYNVSTSMKKNVNNKKNKTIAPEEEKLARELNALDMELYEYVVGQLYPLQMQQTTCSNDHQW